MSTCIINQPICYQILYCEKTTVHEVFLILRNYFFLEFINGIHVVCKENSIELAIHILVARISICDIVSDVYRQAS